MLHLNPARRAMAAELVCHRWLEGVVVQGEIDAVRRVEREEMQVGVRLREFSIFNAMFSCLPSELRGRLWSLV